MKRRSKRKWNYPRSEAERDLELQVSETQCAENLRANYPRRKAPWEMSLDYSLRANYPANIVGRDDVGNDTR